jgi:hypothetical protein
MAMINSTTAHAVLSSSVTFYSAQRVDIFIDPKMLMLEDGRHDITLTNPNGDSVIVEDAFSVSGGTTVGNPQFRPGAASMAGGELSKRLGRQKPGRKVSGRTGGGPGPTFGRRVQPSAAPAAAAMMISRAAAPVASPLPGGRVENPVQNLSAAQGDLTRKVNAQTQEIAAIDKKIDSVLLDIKNMLLDHSKSIDQKLEQQGKQQQEQFDEKIRHLTPKPGK